MWTATFTSGGGLYLLSVGLSKDHDWRPTIPAPDKKFLAMLQPMHLITLGAVLLVIGIAWQLIRSGGSFLSSAQQVTASQNVSVTANKIPAAPPEVIANIKAPLEAKITSLKNQIDQLQKQSSQTTLVGDKLDAWKEIYDFTNNRYRPLLVDGARKFSGGDWENKLKDKKAFIGSLDTFRGHVVTANNMLAALREKYPYFRDLISVIELPNIEAFQKSIEAFKNGVYYLPDDNNAWHVYRRTAA